MPNVVGRQILTSKHGPREERINSSGSIAASVHHHSKDTTLLLGQRQQIQDVLKGWLT